MDLMRLFTGAQKISVRSALNPLLYLCLLLIGGCIFAKGWLAVALFFILIIFLLAFLFAYFYFLFKNPDYLRSEDYHIRMQSIRLLGDKDNPLSANAQDIVSISIAQMNNPKLPSPNSKKENI